jgi:uncharacterized lipoprotein YajG
MGKTVADNEQTMKTVFILMSAVAGALLSGCATGKNSLVLDTVGPAPTQLRTANSINGTLVVYSAYDINADFVGRDRRSPEYSDYKIFTANGKMLEKVHNNSGTILQDPLAVELPPGKYRVVAHSNGYGYVTVPIVIASRQYTIVHLEGDGFWPDESAFNKTNAVRLPDGVIVGWKAAPEL